MSYIVLKDNAVIEYSLNLLRMDNPRVSFPEKPHAAILAEYGVYSCEHAGDAPDHSSTQRVELDTVRDGGVWRKVWRVIDMTAHEIEAALIAWRETKAIERGYFCINMVMAGILPADEAVYAAKGEWPFTFNAALDGMSDTAKLGAQIEWATAQTIRRNHPLIAMLAGMAGLTELQIDGLFGNRKI